MRKKEMTMRASMETLGDKREKDVSTEILSVFTVYCAV